MTEIESRDRSTILIHYYRAMVGRADVWRMRMDATTNWAIGATAAVVSIALGNASVPHYVVFIASLLTLCFLLLEARRLTFYHLWQQRALLIERGLIRPALWSGQAEAAKGAATRPATSAGPDLAHALDPHLGSTIPTMSLTKAAARRLRRIYLYLFAVQLLAWGLKLSNHPTPVASLDELLSRAQAGTLAGALSLALPVLGFVAALSLAAAKGGLDRKPGGAGVPGRQDAGDPAPGPAGGPAAGAGAS